MEPVLSKGNLSSDSLWHPKLYWIEKKHEASGQGGKRKHLDEGGMDMESKALEQSKKPKWQDKGATNLEFEEPSKGSETMRSRTEKWTAGQNSDTGTPGSGLKPRIAPGVGQSSIGTGYNWKNVCWWWQGPQAALLHGGRWWQKPPKGKKVPMATTPLSTWWS